MYLKGAMNTWIALLRGVNVVGRDQVPMKALAVAFERAGFRCVRTYLQSGNVVFQSRSGTARTLGVRIAQLVLKEFGFEPRVMVISGEQLATAIRGNPFPAADENHKLLHLHFLAESPKNPDLKALARLDAGREQFALRAASSTSTRPTALRTPCCERESSGAGRRCDGAQRAHGERG